MRVAVQSRVKLHEETRDANKTLLLSEVEGEKATDRWSRQERDRPNPQEGTDGRLAVLMPAD